MWMNEWMNENYLKLYLRKLRKKGKFYKRKTFWEFFLFFTLSQQPPTPWPLEKLLFNLVCFFKLDNIIFKCVCGGGYEQNKKGFCWKKKSNYFQKKKQY